MINIILLLLITTISYADIVEYAEKGDLKAVQQCINKGIDVDTRGDDDFKGTALMWSAGMGHLDIVKYLLDKGADINKKDELGDTALMWASYGGKLNVIKYLISKGVDINVKNNDGALTRAKEAGNKETIDFLTDLYKINTP